MSVNSFNAQNPPLTTKGDVYTFSTIPTRLGVGTNGQVLTADSTAATGMKWATPSGGGKVLQVVQATYSTAASNGSNAYADTGLSASITPSASTSKVLIIVTQPFEVYRATSSSFEYAYYKLLRGSTGIMGDGSNENQIRIPIPSSLNDAYFRSVWNISYLDSPATTSSTTYKTQGKNESSQTLTSQFNSTTSSIILMEIGA